MRIPKLALLLLLAAMTAGAQTQSTEYERVLLPVWIGGPIEGANGSVWRTTALGWNESQSYVHVTWAPTGGCVIPEGCPEPALPGTVFRPSVHLTVEGRGVFLYVARPNNAKVHFSLRVHDLSRQALTWGTELPIIRENEISADPLALLGVPTDSRFRQRLRIFDFDGRKGAQVLLRARGSDARTVLLETIITLTKPEMNDDESTPTFPTFAEFDLVRTYPQLASSETVHLEILPTAEGQRTWAFVSVTNNETQHVTTITPQ